MHAHQAGRACALALRPSPATLQAPGLLQLALLSPPSCPCSYDIDVYQSNSATVAPQLLVTLQRNADVLTLSGGKYSVPLTGLSAGYYQASLAQGLQGLVFASCAAAGPASRGSAIGAGMPRTRRRASAHPQWQRF